MPAATQWLWREAISEYCSALIDAAHNLELGGFIETLASAPPAPMAERASVDEPRDDGSSSSSSSSSSNEELSSSGTTTPERRETAGVVVAAAVDAAVDDPATAQSRIVFEELRDRMALCGVFFNDDMHWAAEASIQLATFIDWYQFDLLTDYREDVANLALVHRYATQQGAVMAIERRGRTDVLRGEAQAFKTVEHHFATQHAVITKHEASIAAVVAAEAAAREALLSTASTLRSALRCSADVGRDSVTFRQELVRTHIQRVVSDLSLPSSVEAEALVRASIERCEARRREALTAASPSAQLCIGYATLRRRYRRRFAHFFAEEGREVESKSRRTSTATGRPTAAPNQSVFESSLCTTRCSAAASVVGHVLHDLVVLHVPPPDANTPPQDTLSTKGSSTSSDDSQSTKTSDAQARATSPDGHRHHQPSPGAVAMAAAGRETAATGDPVQIDVVYDSDEFAPIAPRWPIPGVLRQQNHSSLAAAFNPSVRRYRDRIFVAASLGQFLNAPRRLVHKQLVELAARPFPSPTAANRRMKAASCAAAFRCHGRCEQRLVRVTAIHATPIGPLGAPLAWCRRGQCTICDAAEAADETPRRGIIVSDNASNNSCGVTRHWNPPEFRWRMRRPVDAFGFGAAAERQQTEMAEVKVGTYGRIDAANVCHHASAAAAAQIRRERTLRDRRLIVAPSRALQCMVARVAAGFRARKGLHDAHRRKIRRLRAVMLLQQFFRLTALRVEAKRKVADLREGHRLRTQRERQRQALERRDKLLDVLQRAVRYRQSSNRTLRHTVTRYLRAVHRLQAFFRRVAARRVTAARREGRRLRGIASERLQLRTRAVTVIAAWMRQVFARHQFLETIAPHRLQLAVCVEAAEQAQHAARVIGSCVRAFLARRSRYRSALSERDCRTVERELEEARRFASVQIQRVARGKLGRLRAKRVRASIIKRQIAMLEATLGSLEPNRQPVSPARSQRAASPPAAGSRSLAALLARRSAAQESTAIAVMDIGSRRPNSADARKRRLREALMATQMAPSENPASFAAASVSDDNATSPLAASLVAPLTVAGAAGGGGVWKKLSRAIKVASAFGAPLGAKLGKSTTSDAAVAPAPHDGTVEGRDGGNAAGELNGGPARRTSTMSASLTGVTLDANAAASPVARRASSWVSQSPQGQHHVTQTTFLERDGGDEMVIRQGTAFNSIIAAVRLRADNNASDGVAGNAARSVGRLFKARAAPASTHRSPERIVIPTAARRKVEDWRAHVDGTSPAANHLSPYAAPVSPLRQRTSPPTRHSPIRGRPAAVPHAGDAGAHFDPSRAMDAGVATVVRRPLSAGASAYRKRCSGGAAAAQAARENAASLRALTQSGSLHISAVADGGANQRSMGGAGGVSALSFAELLLASEMTVSQQAVGGLTTPTNSKAFVASGASGVARNASFVVSPASTFGAAAIAMAPPPADVLRRTLHTAVDGVLRRRQEGTSARTPLTVARHR